MRQPESTLMDNEGNRSNPYSETDPLDWIMSMPGGHVAAEVAPQ